MACLIECSFSLPAIIELLKTHEAVVVENMQLLEKLCHWFLQLLLYTEFSQYIDWRLLYPLLPEMLAPSVKGNFISALNANHINILMQNSARLPDTAQIKVTSR